MIIKDFATELKMFMEYNDLIKVSKAAVKAIEEERWGNAQVLAQKACLLMDEWNKEHPAYPRIPLGDVIGYRSNEENLN